MSSSASPHSQTHYQKLGVAPQAPADAIRQAYRSLSKQYHPDTSPLPPELAIRRFQELQDAYEVLSDPVQRAVYDASLQIWQRYPYPPSSQPPRSPLEIDMETRPLSSSEVFALALMAVTFLLCLALVGTLAWIRQSQGIGLG